MFRGGLAGYLLRAGEHEFADRHLTRIGRVARRSMAVTLVLLLVAPPVIAVRLLP
jgi:hypothetical protein